MQGNKLTDAEEERLYLLIEECGEVIQGATKILRMGYEAFNQVDNSKDHNRHELEKELGDVQHIIELMCDNKDVNAHNIIDAQDRKKIRISQWLKHN